MLSKLFSFVSVCAVATGVLIASDARASGPTLDNQTSGADMAIFFHGNSFNTTGGTVWVGISLNGSEVCIWDATPDSSGNLSATRGLCSFANCTTTYQAWAYDWTLNEASNTNIYVKASCGG